MPVRFTPNGALDIATDPADLPAQMEGKVEVSGAMTRCTNLTLDRMGQATTRWGSAKVGVGAVNTPVHRLIEQAGVRFAFAEARIYRNEVSIADTLTDAAWSTILYNPYNSTTQTVYGLNGTDRKKAEGSTVYEWGIDAPTVAPTLAAGALTGLTGDYNAKYSYCRKSGSTILCESNLSPAGAAAEPLSDGSLSVTWTASSDAQVTHVRVYRTLTDGTTYYHDQDVAIGTVTVDTNTADSALGAGEVTTHNRPPLGSVVLGPGFDGSCFILKDNLLYFCLPRQPEYWPISYYLEVCIPQYPLKAAAFLDGQLFVANALEIYGIMGTGASSFYPLPMSALTGTQSMNCFCAIKGFGIFHLGTDGIYQYTGGKDQKISSSRFDPLFQGETKGLIVGINTTYLSNCWMIPFKGKLYFGYPGLTSTYPDNALVIDLNTDRWIHYALPAQFSAVCVDSHNNRLLVADSAGYIWQLEDSTATDDEGTAISWEIQTAEFNQLRKYFPRYARYDVTVGTGATAQGDILLDDVSAQAHTITGTRQTKKRLITGCTGDRVAVKLSGTGTVTIYGVEAE